MQNTCRHMLSLVLTHTGIKNDPFLRTITVSETLLLNHLNIRWKLQEDKKRIVRAIQSINVVMDPYTAVPLHSTLPDLFVLAKCIVLRRSFHALTCDCLIL